MTVEPPTCDGASSAQVIGGVQCGVTGRTDTSAIEISSVANCIFYSLGIATTNTDGPDYGGTLLMSFDPMITGNASVIEVTNVLRSVYPEAAEVWVGNYINVADMIKYGTKIGVITNETATSTFNIGGVYAGLMLRDVSMDYAMGLGHDPKDFEGNVADGFDVDAISVSAVPVPVAAQLMGSAIGALGFVRRRKSRKA